MMYDQSQNEWIIISIDGIYVKKKKPMTIYAKDIVGTLDFIQCLVKEMLN